MPTKTARLPEKEEQIVVAGKKFKLFIYSEKRNDCRISIGKKGLHLRLSKYFTAAEKQKQYHELLAWAKEYIVKNELYKPKVTHRLYRDGDMLKVMGKEFTIRLHYEDKETSKGNLKNGMIFLTLSKDMSAKQEQKHKSYLVSRLIGNEFQPKIAERLTALNKMHFKKPVKKLIMRDNVSCWGSCTWDGNITISTRLLFAPQEVIDYVLIHELAHLIEHNHSKRFWSLVEKIMPGYMMAEDWLFYNGGHCIF